MGRPKKTVQIEVNRQFLNWCSTNGLLVKKNHEVFFVNERFLLKPEYIVNDKIYVDIIPVGQFNEDNIGYYEMFANSFGTLIVIREEDIDHLIDITKEDLEEEKVFKF